MAGFALRRRTENDRHVVVPFDVCAVGEIQIAPIRLRFACERVLQILFRLTAFELHGSSENLVIAMVAGLERRIS